MKKVFTLLVLMVCAIGTAWAEGGVEKATKQGSSNVDITGTCYSIAGTYVAGAGASKAGDMVNEGVKLRTGVDGARAVFTVKAGYTITDFKLYGISNYALKDGASEPCISVTKVEVDGTETSFDGGGKFPAKGSSTSGSILLSGISATSSIAIYFDNSNASGTQINAYYELTWEMPDAEQPTSTVITPSSANVNVGESVTLKGSFTGGTFTGEWSSDDESVATVTSDGKVLGVAPGTANITFQWTEDQSEDTYKATAKITVLEGFNPAEYKLVKKYDFANWGATTLTIATEKAGSIWNEANNKVNDVFYCTNEGLENIAIQAVLSSSKGWSINENGLYEGSSAGRCAAVGGIKEGQVVEFKHNSTNLFYTKNEGEDDGLKKTPLVVESNHHVFRALEDGMIGFELVKGHYVESISIYEVANLTGEDTELSFSESSVNISLGESFTPPTLTSNPSSLTGIVYSSSNQNVATVDSETGEVTIVGLGTTTIEASFAGDDTYNPSSASYKLNVTMAAVDNKTWDFSTWDDEGNFDITETTIIDGLQVAASESGKVGINSNVLKFGGTGAATHRHIRFRIAEGTHLITIVAKHAGSGAARPLRMSFGTFGTAPQEWSMIAGASAATLYYTYEGNETDVYIYSGSSGINLSSVSVSSTYEVPVTVATDMATYVTPFAMDFSSVDGLKAYVVSEVTATSAKLEEVGAVPANTPVLLEGKGIFTVPVASSASAPAANELKAGSATMADGDYILKGGKFVPAIAGTTLPAGKAYLSVPAGAREINLVLGGATAISEQKTVEADGAIYNLNGVRVDKAQKGIYIQNGKKIVK